MSTLRKRKSRWTAQIRRKDYPPISKTFDFKMDAEKWSRKIERMIDCGEWSKSPLPNLWTLGALLDLYQSEVVPQKRGQMPERYRIRTLRRSKMASLKLVEITSKHIAHYRDQRQTKVSGSSVRKELQIISHAWNIGRSEWGLELSNPVTPIRKPTENRKRDRRLEGGEEKRLLLSATQSMNPNFKKIIIFALETGMRRGELLNLRGADLRLDNRYLRIGLTKNGESRDVPLSSIALQIAGEQRVGEGDRLFTLSSTALRGLWNRACGRADIKDLHFHDLRHEATSRFFESGLNVMEVASITGHKDLRMLQRYTHLRAEDLAHKLK